MNDNMNDVVVISNKPILKQNHYDIEKIAKEHQEFINKTQKFVNNNIEKFSLIRKKILNNNNIYKKRNGK